MVNVNLESFNLTPNTVQTYLTTAGQKLEIKHAFTYILFLRQIYVKMCYSGLTLRELCCKNKDSWTVLALKIYLGEKCIIW